MGKQKLNIRFHNPNTQQATEQYISQIAVELGMEKLKSALLEVNKQDSNIKCSAHELDNDSAFTYRENIAI